MTRKEIKKIVKELRPLVSIMYAMNMKAIKPGIPKHK